MFWNNKLNRPFDLGFRPRTVADAEVIGRLEEAFDRGYVEGRTSGYAEGFTAGQEAYQEHIEHLEERAERYLEDRHSTLWGRAFNVLDVEDRPMAIEYICQTIRGVLNVSR